MNVRLCLNVTDYLVEIDNNEWVDKKIKSLLDRCTELHADQVTFRKMWSCVGTPEQRWIEENCKNSDIIINTIKALVKSRGSLINKLPYGALRYDYNGFSIVVDTDSMAKDETNVATKYYIIRENGKMYSSWDSKASLVF